MKFNDFLNFKIYSNNSIFKISEFYIPELDRNSLYIIKTYPINKLEKIGSYVLDSKIHFNNSESLYPENVLKINLKKGKYVIIIDDGYLLNEDTGIVNDSIMTSLGKPTFKTYSKDVKIYKNDNNVFVFEFNIINEKNPLYIWQNSENAKGKLNFSIYSIKSISNDKKDIYSNNIVFSLDRIEHTNLFLENNYVYDVDIKNIIIEYNNTIEKKYPVGTYQVIYNEFIKKIELIDYKKYVNNDKNNFEFSGNKLSSMKNIKIPIDVDPSLHYSLIGKLDMMLIFDHNNDEYYLYPSGYAECFLNLFLPDDKIELIETNNDYDVYHIIDYSLVNNSYKENDINLNMIQKWISCNRDAINVDEYELFYYIENYNLYEWYYEKFKNIIEDKFIFIELYDIEARVFDDVSKKIESNNVLLDFDIIKCKWKTIEEKQILYNRINWSDDHEWKNYNSKNKIYSIIKGSGILRVTKKHFMNLTKSVSLDHPMDGELNDAQFKTLYNLNWPEVNPFERFQYWTQFKLER